MDGNREALGTRLGWRSGLGRAEENSVKFCEEETAELLP